MSDKRTVQTYKYSPNCREILDDGIGDFVQYGVDYVESELGPGNYSTAIVEMPDGSVKNIPLTLIRFFSLPKKEAE